MMAMNKYIQELLDSELFLVSHYLEQSPEASNHFSGAIGHYLEVGYQHGLNPNPLFDSEYFLASNDLDAQSRLLPPFLVYVRSTGVEAFTPHPLFDAVYYIKSNPDLEECADRIQPLRHFINHGAFEGRNPNKYFDSNFYLARKPHLRDAGIDPLTDYVLSPQDYEWAFHPFYDVEYDTELDWKVKPAHELHLGADFVNKVHADFTQWDEPYDKLLAFSHEPFTHLFIIPGLIRAGAERAACAYIRHFQEIEGLENVLVISADYNNHSSSNWLSEGTRLIDAKALLSLDKGPEEMAFLLTAFILKRKPSFTYSINSFSAITAMARFGELLNSSTSIFLTLFGYETYTANDCELLKHAIFRSAFERADYLVTDTKRLRDEIDRHFPIRKSCNKTTKHCYLASKHLIELVKRQDTRGRETPKPPFKILWASRMINSKRPDMLVDIANSLPEIEFVAYGSADGDFTGESAIQIERVKNTPNISYRGPYEDFRDINLSQVIGFLYTSESDGIPWVLLEATAAGLPIVAPNVGGIGEFLTKENSWLIDRYDDVHAYLKCVRQLLSEPDMAKTKASNALHTLQKQHSEEAFAASLSSILQR